MIDNRLHLSHILECIERIERYTSAGEHFFSKDEKTQDAVLRNLHTLSESSTHITEAVQTQYASIPWDEMRAFRNVVVHDYLGLELRQIWEILTNDLPPLKAAVQEILVNLETNPHG